MRIPIYTSAPPSSQAQTGRRPSNTISLKLCSFGCCVSNCGMGKQKKTRKFAVAKKVISKKDTRMYVAQILLSDLLIHVETEQPIKSAKLSLRQKKMSKKEKRRIISIRRPLLCFFNTIPN